MTNSSKSASNMIYTPITHTPVGVAVKRPDGSHVLRIKNDRTKKFDDFPIERLMTEVIEKALPDTPAETRPSQGLASI